MISLTVFRNSYDNKTDTRIDFHYWSEFCEMLEDLSKKQLAGKKFAPLISPAVYQEGTTRANRNVTEWGGWAAVDVDEYKGSVDGIVNNLRGINTCIYSTASSLPETPKFRIVFSLDRRVQAGELKHFWYALNKSLGDLGDAQTKDSSRMYYVPATYDGAHNFIHFTHGVDLRVDKLMQDFPYQETTGNSFLDRLPPEMREQVIEHRKNSLNNTDVTWTSYHDCPFFPNRMAMDYKSIAGTGWYHGLYKIMIAVACNAVKAGYPITSQQIASMCKQLDQESGNWYENRPLEREAQSALQWAYSNAYEE